MYGKTVPQKNSRIHIALSNLKKEATEKTKSVLHACGSEVDDEKTREIIEDIIFSLPISEFFPSSLLAQTADRIFCQIRRELGILAPLAEDLSITEIMVNGPNHIFIEKDGRISKSEYFFDTTEELEEVIRRIAARVHREINEMVPILDARLENGDHIFIIKIKIGVFSQFRQQKKKGGLLPPHIVNRTYIFPSQIIICQIKISSLSYLNTTMTKYLT